MLGAPVAAHAVCAPIPVPEQQAVVEQPFGLGAVAGGGYNPPQRLSDLYRRRNDEQPTPEPVADAIDALIDEVLAQPEIDLDAIYQAYLAEQHAEAQRRADVADLNRALSIDEGADVVALWQSELAMTTKMVAAIVERVGAEVQQRDTDMKDMQRLVDEDRKRTMQAIRNLFAGLMRGNSSVH